MKFVSVRELRNHPGDVREQVRSEDLVLTVNGKPVAVMMAVIDENLEATLLTLRRVRAQAAVTGLRRDAELQGTGHTTLGEINTEIAAVRAARPAA